MLGGDQILAAESLRWDTFIPWRFRTEFGALLPKKNNLPDFGSSVGARIAYTMMNQPSLDYCTSRLHSNSCVVIVTIVVLAIDSLGSQSPTSVNVCRREHNW